MAKGIGRQSIGGRQNVAHRQIAGRFGQVDVGYAAQFNKGSWTFIAPKAGFYKFVGWGAGGGGSNPGGTGASGAYVEVTRYLNAGQAVPLTVGASAFAASGAATLFGFPNNPVTAGGGGGPNGAGGVAVNADFGLNGSAGTDATVGAPAGQGTGGGAGTSSGGGSGAPGQLPWRGADGSPGGTAIGSTPGSGGTFASTSTAGGNGLAIVYFVRP